jgi:septal ring factor EnvC (AmiA/AmiB activator)
VLSAVGVVVAVAAASIPLALINCEKSTNKQIAATEKRIDGLEKSTEKQMAALEKSTEKQIAATEKRMVVIEESTKSINTKLETLTTMNRSSQRSSIKLSEL